MNYVQYIMARIIMHILGIIILGFLCTYFLLYISNDQPLLGWCLLRFR